MAEVRGGLDQAEMREVARWRFAKPALIRFLQALLYSSTSRPSQKCRGCPRHSPQSRADVSHFLQHLDFGYWILLDIGDWRLETSWPVRRLMVAQPRYGPAGTYSARLLGIISQECAQEYFGILFQRQPGRGGGEAVGQVRYSQP